MNTGERIAAIDARRAEISAAGDARLKAACPHVAALCPTVHDWLTPEERWEDHALGLERVALEREWWGVPADRLALKRALRAAGANFELDAPIHVLREILEKSACVGTKEGSLSAAR